MVQDGYLYRKGEENMRKEEFAQEEKLEFAKKIFVADYLQKLVKEQLACGGSGGGGTTWKKC